MMVADKPRKSNCRNEIYLLIEPAEVKPIWFSCMEESLRKSCQKKRLSLHIVRDIAELEQYTPHPICALVLCSQNNWTLYAVNELRRFSIMPVLLGAVPEAFGPEVSGIVMARRVFIEKVMDYFVQCGRRRMALIGVNRNASNDSVKVDAFLRNGREMGLDIGPEDVYYTDTDIYSSIEGCLHHADRYDSVICSNDYVAVMLLSQASAKKIRVPENMYVIGLGNTQIGLYTEPTLTTTTDDEYFEMGRQAINVWQIFSENPSLGRIVVTVNAEIIPRGSTAFVQPHWIKEAQHAEEIPLLKLGNGNQTLRNLENCLRRCDELDIRILHAMLAGERTEEIENNLFLAHSSLHYRMKRMYQLANVQTRKELEELFRYYLPNF